ncbi:MAG: hypothetical protein E7264_09275 [Lachnospiraceae bacterium]|nr:hypothetical protein [Lachnospiraceae bacterium]
MLLRILRFFIGYLKVEVTGFAPERLMNLIIKNDIVIWDVETLESGYVFYTGRYNFLKIKPYLKKTNTKIKVLMKYGFPYFLKRNKKRVAFLVGFGICICITYLFSLFVWEVKIDGEKKIVKEDILEYIEKKHVPLGTLKSKVNCAVLEKQLREQYDDISWITCELKGTCLNIYLEEGSASVLEKKNDVAGDIIASKDATITKMITREGTPLVKVKQEVKKGDILISGTIYIYDDNNEVLETSYIPADGDVYGITSLDYEDYVELEYYDKKYQENNKGYVTIYIFDYCVTPFMPNKPNGNYDTFTDIHKMKLLDNFYLPLGYTKTEWKSYQLVKNKRSEKEATKILNKRLQEKITSFKEKGVEIIKNDVKIIRDGNRVYARGTLTLEESIIKFQENLNHNIEEQKSVER